MLKKIITAALMILSLCALLFAGCSASPATNSTQQLAVTRGNLNIIVSTSGNLSVPYDYNLRFGTPGKVKDILVQEGDVVKQGSILAFLDDTAQRNAIEVALFNLRAAISNVADNNGAYSTSVTFTQVFLGTYDPDGTPNYAYIPTYTNYGTSICSLDIVNKYPDLSAPRMANEAQLALQSFFDEYKAGLSKDAGADLASAYLYIEVCEDLIKSKLDPDVVSGTKANTPYAVETTPGTGDINKGKDREDAYKYTEALDYLAKYKARILSISKLLMNGQKAETISLADSALQDMQTVIGLVGNTVNLTGWDFLKFTDISTSLNFLQASMRGLEDVNDYSAQPGASPDKIAQKLYLAKLNLSTSRNVLQNQDITYWGHQFTWQSLQQYNIAVNNAEIALQKAMLDILNTVIVAPSDGTVVSVGLKKDYILSAQDYSSKPAVELVDTNTIKFSGTVDEIDILKVKRGQTATIQIDALPNKTFTGKVKFISPYGNRIGNVIKFAVTIELDSTSQELRGGLSASADINVYTSSSSVLLVPILALNSGPDGYTVNVITDPVKGLSEPRKVTIGQRNAQYAEVLSGLNEGDKVLPATAKPNSTPRPGGPPR